VETWGLKVRELIRQTCQSFEIKILKGVVSKDQVHLFISAPLTIDSTQRNNKMNQRTSFDLTAEMIKEYLEHHFGPKGDDNFKTDP
jgi:putative transposase